MILPMGISGVRVSSVTLIIFWFPKTFQIVDPTGIVPRESKTLLSRLHG